MKSHMRMRKVNIYVQHSREQMAESYNEPRNRFLNSNVDLATQPDVVERLHLAGAEPEGVTYAEVDANGRPIAVVYRRDATRTACCCTCTPGFRRLVDTHGSKGCWAHRKDGRSSSPAGRLPACAQQKYPAQIEDVEKAYRWLLEQGIRPQNIASIGHS